MRARRRRSGYLRDALQGFDPCRNSAALRYGLLSPKGKCLWTLCLELEAPFAMATFSY